MVGIGKVKHRIAHHHRSLFMVAHETSGERIVVQLDHYAFPGPLPELSLRGPELLTIQAEH